MVIIARDIALELRYDLFMAYLEGNDPDKLFLALNGHIRRHDGPYFDTDSAVALPGELFNKIIGVTGISQKYIMRRSLCVIS